MAYNRDKALQYAEKWALERNPAYYSFDGIGGDCTNFVSQCLFAGCGVMNFTRNTGWYYVSEWNRAAAWTGVEFLHRFLTTNKDAGPYGTELPESQINTPDVLRPGDIIQLSYDGERFGHSLFITAVSPDILVAQHSSQNYYNRPFSSYKYMKARGIRIDGARE